jgi:hypothetical protein
MRRYATPYYGSPDIFRLSLLVPIDTKTRLLQTTSSSAMTTISYVLSKLRCWHSADPPITQVVALSNNVLMVNKKALQKPSRKSLAMTTPTRRGKSTTSY